MTEAVRLSDMMSPTYYPIWDCKKPYIALKGSKGSGKSKFMSLWLIYHIMKYPAANALVIRRVFGTLKDSCYTDLLWAIDQFKVLDFWKYTVNPLELTYLPTGQTIKFRGLDDPLKLASITVRTGVLTWVWFEEAFEIADYSAVLKVIMSVRGQLPEGLWKQFFFTFNPWSEHHWLKEKFFDVEDENVLAKTTTFRDNPFLGQDDVQRYLDLYKTNPRASRVICDGDWGIAEGLVYDNWVEEEFSLTDVLSRPKVKTVFGLDFGYAVSYNAFIAAAVDMKERIIWVYDEMYERGMTNLDIARRITNMGYAKEEIWADAAEPKSIYELQQGLAEEVVSDDGNRTFVKYQLPAIKTALKGPDSVVNGIQRLQSFKIIVHPRCSNTIMELSNYAWETDKDGKYTGKPIKDFDHLMDSLRYGCTKLFITGKGHVAEAKGMDIVPIGETPRRSKRVASTL